MFTKNGAPRNERSRYLFTKLRPVGNHGLHHKPQLAMPVGITPAAIPCS